MPVRRAGRIVNRAVGCVCACTACITAVGPHHDTNLQTSGRVDVDTVPEFGLARLPPGCVGALHGFRPQELCAGCLATWTEEAGYRELRTVELQRAYAIGVACLGQTCRSPTE